jgi:hypothetical protein
MTQRISSVGSMERIAKTEIQTETVFQMTTSLSTLLRTTLQTQNNTEDRPL